MDSSQHTFEGGEKVKGGFAVPKLPRTTTLKVETPPGSKSGPPTEAQANALELQTVMAPSPEIMEPEDQLDTEDPLLDVVIVNDEKRMRCTGVLVAPAAVLTARHCLPAATVSFGNHTSDPIATLRVVGSVADKGAVDLALLWLEHSSSVAPRRWHELGDGEPRLLGKIAGFGATDSRAQGSGQKRAARIPLQGWGCDLSRGRTTGCDPETEMVLAAPGGIDTCDGDSGGPLFERVGAEWRLLGITSRPLASSRRRCGDGGVYTRIDKAAPWIRRVLATGAGKTATSVR